jgi:hypothetical protein
VHTSAVNFSDKFYNLIHFYGKQTSLTPAGGFFIDLTIVISGGFSVSRACSAASSAGIASARSLSQSSLMAWAAAAASLANASSAPTI